MLYRDTLGLTAGNELMIAFMGYFTTNEIKEFLSSEESTADRETPPPKAGRTKKKRSAAPR
jgi:hypothetical protein